ncbi:hypothetical protein HAX54_042198, partial [Datura stramonium]|nr:hypothetical protein [Datura stramonium]
YSRKDSHFMAIKTRSGKKLSVTTPIGVEQVAKLALETELVAKYKVKKQKPAKLVDLAVTENNEGDEGKAK